MQDETSEEAAGVVGVTVTVAVVVVVGVAIGLSRCKMRYANVYIHKAGEFADQVHPSWTEPVRVLYEKLPNGSRDKGIMIGGGAVVSMLSGEEYNEDRDIDVLVPGAEKFFNKVFASLERKGAMPRGHGESVVARERLDFERYKFDLIHCTSIAEALACFDLRCCAVATDGWHILAAEGALEDIANKRLVTQRDTSLDRFMKYQNRGFRAHESELKLVSSFRDHAHALGRDEDVKVSLREWMRTP